MKMNRQAKSYRATLVLLLLLSITFLKADAGSDTLQVPENFNCACPGEVLTYTCNITGGGTTLWRGSAFDCSSTSNEIRLRHSTFSTAGTSGTCNNEAMRARSIGLTNNDCYTSELSVTVSTGFNDRSIECAYNSGTDETTIGASTLRVAAPEVRGVQFTDLRDGELVLNWTAVPSCVRPIFYNVTSNCSICSSSTANLTTASCPLPQQWTDGLICGFSVQSMICDGNLIGTSRNSLVVTLQEPTVNIVPHYSEKDNTLTKVIIRGINLGIAKSDSRTIYVIEYNVTYWDPDTNTVTHSAPYLTCRKDICNETNITPPSLSRVCSSSTVTVNVTADYGFGQRPLSDPITIGCTNQFVAVQYNSTDSTISCAFLNPNDTSIKSCRVTYGPCDQERTQSVEGVSSIELPNNITLIVPRGSYCYTATANTANFTIAVQGMIQSDSESSEGAAKLNVGAIIGGVVGVGLFIIASIVVLIVVIVVLKLSSRKRKPDGFLQMPNIIPSLEDKLKLELITDRSFQKLGIEKNCKLREAIEYNYKKFKRGHAYYEFIHDKENISEDKELIFMNKVTGEYFSPTVSVDVLYENNLLGEGVRNPGYKKYRVFVQSTGSGARHLPVGSLLLYEQAQSNPWNPEKAPLQRVTSNHFMTSTITNDCTVHEFQTKYDLRINGANVFIECGDAIIEDFRDVMLMDKKTGKLFTGPAARSNPSVYVDKYRVFVLPFTMEKLKLESGRTILYQNPESRQNLKFHVLEVDEDNVQMAKFVEKKLDVKYENGRAFYEFSQMEEDLLFYKDVVVMLKSLDSSKKQDGIEFKSSIVRFYWLSKSVPGVGIQPPSLKDANRVFVQSKSQGSRCLKAKTLLLYKI